MLKRTVNFLRGHVRLEVEGAFPERFLNLCAQNAVAFWGVEWLDQHRLRLTVTRRGSRKAIPLAQRVQCAITPAQKVGAPYFLARFRKRYALLAGLALSLAAVSVLSRFVLTIDVSGNETVSSAQILSELRRQGLRPGVYGPALDENTIIHEALLQLPELAWMTVNLHGTRAEVLVREAGPKPEDREEDQVGDIVARSGGIILRVEALAGEAKCDVGDTVAAGEVLISGHIRLEAPEYSGGADLGWSQVHPRGHVYARTWRTMTAQIPLTAQVKTYTGEEARLWSLNILGRRLVFSRNSGISFPKYDKISRTWTARLPGGQEMPLTLTRETAREYTLSAAPLDQFAVQDMLEGRLREMLEAELGEGEILDAKYTALLRDGALEVTLLAECREEIGRFVPGTQPDSGVQEEHEITNQSINEQI